MNRMLAHERRLWKTGAVLVAGVDEVGMGPMAGPVVAAAVIFDRRTRIDGVDDSKALDEAERTRLETAIRSRALFVGIGITGPREIDRLNVYHAGLAAMRRAVDDLGAEPDHLLVDSRTIPGVGPPQTSLVRGDATSFTIASASIVAKVYRDRLMSELELEYPGYGFARHKGYCTTEHQEAVARLGPSPVHRHSYDYIRELMGDYSACFYRLRDALDVVGNARDVERIEAEIHAADAGLSGSERRKLRLLVRRRKARASVAPGA